MSNTLICAMERRIVGCIGARHEWWAILFLVLRYVFLLYIILCLVVLVVRHVRFLTRRLDGNIQGAMPYGINWEDVASQ